ncbi:hypothetical protein AAFF_G00072810 [Aldrovandia affinis]|uniref:PDZ domain-containing protein n=1 Tax=Aldrovandia affinis TaxID=143900 RepID=A0AAD7R1T0_9TELE|nr:hypothetical protein AAFF_G00072810 [Aldrovandia affinis]
MLKNRSRSVLWFMEYLETGGAVKAGVHEGDRIIKVNGSLVSTLTHQEVVKLIKSGTYAALTLQGPVQPLPTDPRPITAQPRRPPLCPAAGHASPRITRPKPLQCSVNVSLSLRILRWQKQASQILRKMLEQEEAELQVLQGSWPSPSSEQRIRSAKRRAPKGGPVIKIRHDPDGARIETVANYLRAVECELLTLKVSLLTPLMGHLHRNKRL